MVADSLHGISDHADQSCYKVKERIESEVGDSIFYHDGVAASGHEVNEIRGEKPGHDDNAKAPDPAVEDGLFDAFPDAADLSGTQILSAESSHCGTEYAKDQHEKLGDLSCRSVGNDDIGAEGVDRGLQSNGSEIYEGTHKSHGKAAAEQIFRQFTGDPVKILPVQAQDLVALYHIEKAREHGDELGDYGCDCGAPDAHGERKNAQQIQKNVEDNRYRKEDKRCDGIPYRAQQGGTDIVEHGNDKPCKNDRDIIAGEVDDIRRRV